MEKPAKTTKPASKTSDFNSYISKDSGFFEGIKDTMEWLGEDDGIDSITEDDLMDRLYEMLWVWLKVLDMTTMMQLGLLKIG